jgi:cellobiose dehydrogenase (acceptor)
MKFFGSVVSLAFVAGATAQTYDYIVAGAGAAGIIVAERLSESGASVLLIDRGHQSSYSSGGRALVSWNDTLTQYDVPGLGFFLGQLNDPAGRRYCSDTPALAGCILGGGTEVNLMQWIKPQNHDWENWPSGWNAPDLIPAAQRLYARNPGTITPSMDGRWYDQGAFNLVSNMLDNAGFNEVDSIAQPNAKQNTYSHAASNIANGQRSGPVKTYLPLAQQRSNFRLMLNTNVLRVVRSGSRATGVQIETADGTRSIINLTANGRVILAAGVMSTPRILFYSGIGPTQQILNVQNGAVNVDLPPRAQWINLPVGENLRNHVDVELSMTTNRAIVYRGQSDFLNPSQADINLYEQRASGIFAQSGQQINFWTSNTVSDGSRRWFQGTCWNNNANSVHFRLIMTHGATSKGVLGIDGNGNTAFTTPPEMRTAMDRAAYTEFLNSLLNWASASGSPLTYTGGKDGAGIAANARPGLHYVGTTKMGRDSGLTGGTSVVGLNCKVYGTDNIFVVDASMHPDLPTGNTMAITMVAAENAAARILAL